MGALKPQSRDLLIDRKMVFRRMDRGIDWLTDRYILARADVFKSAPSETDNPLYQGFSAKVLRGVLDGVRAIPIIEGRVTLTDLEWEAPNGKPVAVVRCGHGFLVGINQSAWQTWAKTGLSPSLNAKAQLLWHGNVRGKRALFGVIQPVRVGGWR